jgi:UDP-glucuronate 4-epimerase
MSTILVTGNAGFIGHHVALRLARGNKIVGLDNINDYYDTDLKYARLEDQGFPRDSMKANVVLKSTEYDIDFIKCDLEDTETVSGIFSEYSFDYVVHLAAQAGVRYSVENPKAYIDSNIYGFLNILEGCQQTGVKHLVYASSSSVYGGTTETEFREDQQTENPLSMYAATKKSNELMAHVFSSIHNLPVTGLRLFTVYGPWARPDMALQLFTTAMSKGESIKVFNDGKMERDFTYIDDIVEGITRIMEIIPASENGQPPCKVFNIGSNRPTKLMDFIREIEKQLGKEAKIDMQPPQPGDMIKTFANCDALEAYINFKPRTPLADGIKAFVDWFKSYYNY